MEEGSAGGHQPTPDDQHASPTFNSDASTLQEKPARNSPALPIMRDYPRGYPNLAAFQNSDEAYTIYRRFGLLQSRLLLYKQDKLRGLEAQLKHMDDADSGCQPDTLTTNNLDDSRTKPRRDLFETIEKTFNEYVQLLTSAQTVMSFNKPSRADCGSVANHLSNRGQLVRREQKWIYQKEDLITLRSGRERAWLDTALEHLLKWINCGCIEYIFCSKESRQKSDDPNEVYYDRSRILILVNTILTASILALLIVPVYILYHLINNVESENVYAIYIGVLLVATLAFSADLVLFTSARRHEILASSAA
ncbi:hypothetical protein BDY21DRAFT_416543 [Lineolata rhizophorae]|uniref:DUF6594 domain-containing protein n=1 Tax=Lineolata rhizophorae TaxID=578093 RepID=A0A6A6NU24_9PEZI|nr:hypothetical protein BDY21DRAFT_416543 [Lineolata rhizophorae]